MDLFTAISYSGYKVSWSQAARSTRWIRNNMISISCNRLAFVHTAGLVLVF